MEAGLPLVEEILTTTAANLPTGEADLLRSPTTRTGSSGSPVEGASRVLAHRLKRPHERRPPPFRSSDARRAL